LPCFAPFPPLLLLLLALIFISTLKCQWHFARGRWRLHSSRVERVNIWKMREKCEQVPTGNSISSASPLDRLLQKTATGRSTYLTPTRTRTRTRTSNRTQTRTRSVRRSLNALWLLWRQGRHNKNKMKGVKYQSCHKKICSTLVYVRVVVVGFFYFFIIFFFFCCCRLGHSRVVSQHFNGYIKYGIQFILFMICLCESQMIK